MTETFDWPPFIFGIKFELLSDLVHFARNTGFGVGLLRVYVYSDNGSFRVIFPLTDIN